jgi:hypothetical protein
VREGRRGYQGGLEKVDTPGSLNGGCVAHLYRHIRTYSLVTFPNFLAFFLGGETLEMGFFADGVLVGLL